MAADLRQQIILDRIQSGISLKAARMVIYMLCSIRYGQEPLFDSTLFILVELSHCGPVQSYTNHQLCD